MFLLKVSLLLATSNAIITEQQTRCPTWYIPTDVTSNTSSGSGAERPATCRCGAELDGVLRCNRSSQTVSLAVLHCMTHSPDTETVEGYCPYGRVPDTINTIFNLQPSTASNLTDYTCSEYNRTGILCSRCEDSLGVAVLSYSFECVECLGALRGWLLYLFLAFVPLTIFFVAVIVCDIDVTAPHMNSLLCIMQIIMFSLNTNPQTFLRTRKAASRYLVVGAWTIVGFWNLDVFRYVYPPFCITPGISTFQAISLEYLVAFYPILLILVAYILIELHDRDYRIVYKPWLYLRRVLKHCKGNCCCSFCLQAKRSILKYFSTFLLLAYTKVLFVNFNLLAFTEIYRSDGSRLNESYYAFYNASVRYFSTEHLPYFILASFVLILFNILPLLLLLVYPMRCFQKCLTCCSAINWHPLRAFADKFQGCYKDGTCQSRDYRYFAALYLLLRVVYHLRAVWNNRYTMFVVQVVPLTAAVSFGVLRPYKNDLYNRLDCGLFTILTFGQICLATNKYVASIPITLLYIFATIPITYLLSLLLYKVLTLCAPNTTDMLKRKVKLKLLKHNLLFSSDSDAGNSYDELRRVDDGSETVNARVCNPLRCICTILSRFQRSKTTRQVKKTTYSTIEISQ